MSKRVTVISILVMLTASVFAALIARDSFWDTRPQKLVCSSSSIEELAHRFLTALRKEDSQAISDVAISREEFDRYVWPELPASRPGTNLTPDFVWGQLNMRSRADIRGTFERNKGKNYTLIEVRFEDGVDEYPSFKVHKDARLVVKDESGKRRVVNLFGSVMELDGEFKIFSFVL